MKSQKSKKTIDDAHFQTYKMFEKVLINNEGNADARKKLLSFEDFNYSQFNQNVFAIRKKEVESQQSVETSEDSSLSDLDGENTEGEPRPPR